MNIHRVEKLTKERWLNLFAATFEHHGQTGRWVFASRHETPHGEVASDAVVIVPILRNPGRPPRLVVLREFRVPVGKPIIGLPAGLVEAGEPLEEAVRRELREETGFELIGITRITQPLFSSSGMTDEAASMVFADVHGDESVGPVTDPGEDIQVMLLDYHDICQICNDCSLLLDIKAWLVLYMIQHQGKLE